MENHSLKHLNVERNCLEDGGCISICEAVRKPTCTLQILEMGNNIIESEGIRALCKALKENQSLTEVDIKQNILDIECEILLQEVLMIKGKKLKLFWRKPRTKDDPELTVPEFQSIIRYFQPPKLIEWYAHEESMQPLVDIDLVFGHIEYTMEYAKRMWQFSLPLQRTSFNRTLQLFIKLARMQIKNHRPDYWLATYVGTHHLNELSLCLEDSSHKTITFGQLQTLQIFHLVVMVNDEFVVHSIMKSQIFKHATNLFFEHPNHSLYQEEFTSLVLHLLSYEQLHYPKLLRRLTLDAKLGSKMIYFYTSESKQPLTKRKGLFGYLTKIGNAFEAALASPHAPDVSLTIKQLSIWPAFVNYLRKVNAMEYIPPEQRPQRDASSVTSIKADEVPDDEEADSKD
eukprot:TRINITY_DN6902_c0_g3_i5.p1 TRINITY_DN6902_c0_g3~~TRINITY_DN6902_c0_g3_i5.p1  ORF type:complete len:454 (+),score=102.21 TRINITY_DN6902_c0_g3_i5:165-1364(+)